MSTKLIVAIVILFAVVIAAAVLIVLPAPEQVPSEENGSSELFVSENVKVSSPLPNSPVPKTFTVVGEARGPWFFEASFPVQVRDPNNDLVGQGIAQTSVNWMTTDFVPFTAHVTVTDYAGPATLVLLKDNPSGLPELDDAVSFDIIVE